MNTPLKILCWFFGINVAIFIIIAIIAIIVVIIAKIKGKETFPINFKDERPFAKQNNKRAKIDLSKLIKK